MQFVCLPCAQEESFHEYEGVSKCARDILENFALSDMGFYHCEDCSEVFCSEMDAMQHTQASRKAMQSQCMLSGPYVEMGRGAIVPFIDLLACPSAMTSCKYCGNRMQVDQWVHHVRMECTMVPCALCLESLSGAATTYARQKLGESHRNVTMMHCERIFEPFNKAAKCCYTSGTFKKMVRHMQVPSEEHRRGLQCLRDFVMHVDKEGMAPVSNALQVAPSPLQLVTVGTTSFSCLHVDTSSNQRGGGTPVGGVSCKSPRCANAMVANVSGKCPERIRHQKEEAEARASELKKQKQQQRRRKGANKSKGKVLKKKKKKKTVVKKKITKKTNAQSSQKLPIRLLIKRRKEANGGDDKKQQEQQDQQADRPSKRRRRQIESSAPDTNTTTTNTFTATTSKMITPSMIAKSWVTSSESDPTLRVVIVKPRATKAHPPPPPKAKARHKPPPPPYPPPQR